MGKVPAPAIQYTPAAESNFDYGRGGKSISRGTFHHIVGTGQSAVTTFQNPSRGASSNYIVGEDGRIYQPVREENTAWCDGNYASNQITISVEHAGGHPSVPYTQAMYESAIRLWAWIIDRYGISDFKRHRDVSLKSTACPGELNVEYIVQKARELRDSYYAAPPAPAPSPNPVKRYVRFPEVKKMSCKLQPTKLWDFNTSSWSGFKEVKSFNAGEMIDCVGYAEHSLGGIYYMTSYSFGNADVNGTPNKTTGINVADLVEYVEPQVPPQPSPVPPADPAPEPPADPTPKPAPDPQPTPEPQPEPAPEPEYPNWFVAFWIKLIEAIKKILGKA